MWRVGSRSILLDRPAVMGVLNLTPDSFSDGGSVPALADAMDRAATMIEAGAVLLDVGGESTRPGASVVPADQEMARILPFIREASRAFDVPISVDTRKAAVARAAVEAGATVVNDVSGLGHDPELAAVVAEAGAGVVLMHMRGDPGTMSGLTDYGDLVQDVKRELAQAVERARAAGIAEDRIVVDPGIGFAKTAAQSLTLIRDLGALAELGFPVLLGPSRKSFLGAVLGLPPGQRVEGTLAACVAGYLAGARIFRVHDVEPAVRALAVARAIAHPEVLG